MRSKAPSEVFFQLLIGLRRRPAVNDNSVAGARKAAQARAPRRVNALIWRKRLRSMENLWTSTGADVARGAQATAVPPRPHCPQGIFAEVGTSRAAHERAVA